MVPYMAYMIGVLKKRTIIVVLGEIINDKGH